MTRRFFPAGPMAAAGLALALAGCGETGDLLPREPVSGKVTIEGQPLAKGSILFRPAGGGTEAGGEVAEGAFEVARADGPPPGKYQVSVTEAVERPEEDKLNNFSLQPKTKPSKTVIGGPIDAEVKAGGPNAFTFDFPKVDVSKRSKGQVR
ncbi:hypothetical protein [Paludisphaera mucosa]|uniref:Carboxypeptidase regulatory-like domain-containing protein n=1 Tax=Paludisphaera mucosa TaxID=3030827 RepID=A0ABT6F783_9BACT|nr:hypothetical protein [Paludisphaera mucosa]MDG3003443.1 hypothetical protein [Paludisphaera mucosa]